MCKCMRQPLFMFTTGYDSESLFFYSLAPTMFAQTLPDCRVPNERQMRKKIQTKPKNRILMTELFNYLQNPYKFSRKTFIFFLIADGKIPFCLIYTLIQTKSLKWAGCRLSISEWIHDYSIIYEAALS